MRCVYPSNNTDYHVTLLLGYERPGSRSLLLTSSSVVGGLCDVWRLMLDGRLCYKIDEIDSRTAESQPKKLSPAGRLRTTLALISRRVDSSSQRGRSRAQSCTTDIPLANHTWHGRPRHKSRQRLRRRHLAANHRRRFTSSAPRPLRGLTLLSPQRGRRSPSCHDSPALRLATSPSTPPCLRSWSIRTRARCPPAMPRPPRSTLAPAPSLPRPTARLCHLSRPRPPLPS